MNKHEKPKTNKIGKILLTGLTSLTIAGIGAGVACIVTAGGNSQEPTNVKTSTTQTSTSQSSSSQSVTKSSSKEATSKYTNHKTPGIPDYNEFYRDPVKFFSETFTDYTYDDSCPGSLPNMNKTITNVAYTKFAAETYQEHYYFCQPADWLTDPNITEPYELYDALCDNATCQWQGTIGYKQGGYEPVVGDIIIFSDIKDFDNEDPTHYISGVVYQDGWYITTRTSLYSVNCCGNSTQILMDILKKLGTDYRYAAVFTLDH